MKKSLFVVFILLLGGLMVLAYGFYSLPVEHFTVGYDVEIMSGQGALGFNADKDKLHFGRMYAGDSSFRDFWITNNASSPRRVDFKIVSLANISTGGWFFLEPTSGYVLSPQERKKFRVILGVPLRTPAGIYEGGVLITLHRPLPWQNAKPEVLPLPALFSENFLEIVSRR